jgi:hypothetical protein
MAIEPIGDISDVSLSESILRTWETAGDWDNFTSQQVVGHESTANSQWDDDSILQIGYPTEQIPFSSNCIAYFPMQETSGATFHDFSTNANDATITDSPTLDDTDLFGKGRPSFNGSSNEADAPQLSEYTQAGLSIVSWFKSTDPGANDSRSNGHIASHAIFDDGWGIRYNSPDFEWIVGDGSRADAVDLNPNYATDDTWHCMICTWDGSTAQMWVDGSNRASDSNSNVSFNANTTLNIGKRDRSGGSARGSWYGELGPILIYDTAFSDSEKDQFYSPVASSATHETATKTFPSASTPDLQNLSYTLPSNGSITLDVIGSPGTASEETVSQTLDGASSYTLTWSNSHTDFRLKPQLSTTDKTTSPTFSRGGLVG